MEVVERPGIQRMRGFMIIEIPNSGRIQPKNVAAL
jgi:hypothetical protein